MEFDERAAEVHARLLDVIEAFETLVERAGPDLKPLAQRMLALHRAHHDQLHLLLEERGHPPDERGSFLGVVQDQVMWLASWFEDADADPIPRIRSDEEDLLGLYDRAIEAGPVGDRDRETLQSQRDAIEREIQAFG